MADSHDAPASGAAAPMTRPTAGRAAADPRSLLRLNNTLQVLTNGAWYVATPFIPLYLVSQGASAGVVGVVVGLSGIAPFAVSIHAGALVDQRGSPVVYLASVVLFGLGGAILTALHGVPAIGVAYTLMAVANIGFAVAAQAIVAGASTDATRIRNYGYYSLWNSAGAVAGPIIGGFIAGRFGYAAAFSAVWILMLPSLAVASSLRHVPRSPRRAVSLRTAYTLAGTILRQRGVGAILFISAMMVCAQALQQSFYPLYLAKAGLPAPMIGLLVAAVSLASMVVRTLLAGGVAWLGTAGSLVGATVLVAGAFAAIPFLHAFWPLAAASGLMGASLGFTQPLTMSLLVESVAAELWGVALGLRQSMQRVAAIVSPLVFGAASAARGVESAFFVGAAAMLGAAGIMTRFAEQIGRRDGGRT